MHFIQRMHLKVPVIIQYFQARDAGVAHQKWLMVNVQNVLEFSCQILNRDIWSNKAVKTVIKEHFIFWQVSFLNSLSSISFSCLIKYTFSMLCPCFKLYII